MTDSPNKPPAGPPPVPPPLTPSPPDAPASSTPAGAAPGGTPVAAPTAAEIAATAELARAMGQAINNMYLYSPAHKVVRQSLDKCFELVNKLLESRDSLIFSVMDKNVLVDGQELDAKNPLVASFVKQLVALEVAGFSLVRGMSREEFEKLMELLNSRPEKIKEAGSFSKAVASVGLGHVQAKTVTYQMVTEEDIVVRKGELEQALAGSGGSGQSVEQIIAFLKGDVNVDPGKVAKGLTEISSDADKLAEIIMQATRVEPGSEPTAGASLADLVVGCLHRTYDSLSQDPAAKSQQGKKQLTKTLMLLEKSVRDRLKDVPGGDVAADQVSEAVEEMAIELTIDALATEYAKKRKGIETAEKKILRFVKAKGGDVTDATDELKSKLMESGLTPEDWHELVAKSAASGKKAAAPHEGPDIPGVGMLAALLAELDTVLNAPAPAGGGAGGGAGGAGGAGGGRPGPGGPGGAGGAATEQKIEQVISRMNEEVVHIAADAEHRIDDLAREIKAADAAEKTGMGAGVKPALSRAKLFAILAEIVQELLQPVAVINCSVEMIRMKRLGEVTQGQIEMLNLAKESVDRIQKLGDKLMDIAGVPKGLTPDSGMISTFYK